MPKVTEKIPEPVLSVKAALTALGVADTVRIFDEEVPTAAAAASVLGCEVAAITNSLIFEVDGEPLLILASGAARVDTAHVARRLETGKIRRAKHPNSSWRTPARKWAAWHQWATPERSAPSWTTH